MIIQHKGEPVGNKVRRAMDGLVGRAQSTYTPTLAVVGKAKGVHLWTVDKHKLLDFTSGVLVSNLGYGHPIFEARFKQYRRQLPWNSYNMLTEVQVEATRRLVQSMGAAKLKKVFWAASGSEGVQKAMWSTLHRYPERPIMVATRFGFHGKKGLAAEVTGESSKNPNVRWISFPMKQVHEPAYYQKELDALWKANKGRIALLITEPYLGAKGSFHPPKWYHKLLQKWCNAHDIPFIFDEVQSCFGRTGNMYAFQTYGVKPDLVVLGKGLANGEPAAAVVGRPDLIDAMDYGEASDTFSGNTGACAAVCATLDAFEAQHIVAQAKSVGRELRHMLLDLRARFPFIMAVRGEGMVYGVEITDKETANRCVLEAYRGDGSQGVHFLGPLAEKVLRVSPPLVMQSRHIEEARRILETAWARI